MACPKLDLLSNLQSHTTLYAAMDHTSFTLTTLLVYIDDHAYCAKHLSYQYEQCHTVALWDIDTYGS